MSWYTVCDNDLKRIVACLSPELVQDYNKANKVDLKQSAECLKEQGARGMTIMLTVISLLLVAGATYALAKISPQNAYSVYAAGVVAYMLGAVVYDNRKAAVEARIKLKQHTAVLETLVSDLAVLGLNWDTKPFVPFTRQDVARALEYRQQAYQSARIAFENLFDVSKRGNVLPDRGDVLGVVQNLEMCSGDFIRTKEAGLKFGCS